MHESIFLVLPPPTCTAHSSAILLHASCAIYDPPRPPPAYAIHHTILAMQYRVKAKRCPRPDWLEGDRAEACMQQREQEPGTMRCDVFLPPIYVYLCV